MKTPINLFAAIFIFSCVTDVCRAEIVVTIESAEDLAKYGFECVQQGGEEGSVCEINTVTSALDLPIYFPNSFKTLTGNNLMYLSSSNGTSPGTFALISSQLPVTTGTYVMFRMEYYTEDTNAVGYMIFWADAGIGFFGPSSNSEWKLDYSKSVVKATFETNEVTYFLTNDYISKFSVFRKLEIIIDPEPQYKISISSLEDFANSDAVCPNCMLGSVKSGQDLPSYFPDTFRQLPLTGNEEMMFVDFANTVFPTIIMADLATAVNLSCTGYVDLLPEYYNEVIGSFGWGKTYNSWSTYGTSDELSTWTVGDDSAFFHLDYYLMQGNRLVGFHALNDGFNKMSVFKKLEARIYYYPQPEVNCRSFKPISLQNNPFKNLIRALEHKK